MFSAEIQSLQSGTDRYVLSSDQSILNYDQVIEHGLSNESFRSFISHTLINSRFSAFRFETPPVSIASRFHPFEFVLIESPWLDRAQDVIPFEEHFEDTEGQEVVVFNNLGGDATLVVPTPSEDKTNYAHFGGFLRTASDLQKDVLIQTIAQALSSRLTDKPIWLNTAGGGVDWLHIRLDARPKYYAHQPYRLSVG